MSGYRTPKGRTRTELRVSNSRFIATIAPAASMADAQALLREIRAEMPDATHHVHAFKIGYGASVIEAMSDDGEPSGTSGPPALAVLRGADIGDAALVITRYFGGAKLGTGGLVAAYTQAAKAVLAIAPTELKILRHRYTLAVPYRLHAPVRRLLTEFEAIVEQEVFEAEVRMTYLLARERASAFAARLADATSGQFAPQREP
jgi:uncharacterized YigZ family protein